MSLVGAFTNPFDHHHMVMDKISGGGGGSSSANPASVQLAALQQEQRQDFNQNYVPVLSDAVKSLHSNDVVNTAAAQIGDPTEQQNAVARTNRDLARYGGVPGQDKVATQEMQRAAGLNQATYDTNTMNNAYAQQYQRNQSLRSQLINTTNGLATGAQDNLVASANAETQRNMSNKQAAAADTASKQQTGLAIGTTIATIAIAM